MDFNTYTKVKIDVKGQGRFVGAGTFKEHLNEWQRVNPDKQLLEIDYDTKTYIFEDSEHYGYQCNNCELVTKYEDEIIKHENICKGVK